MPKDNPLVVLPPVNLAPHLVAYASELGLFKSYGMGLAPMGWIDILAWASLTGTELHPEEARTLRDMSAAYVAHSSAAKDYECDHPYPDETPEATTSAKPASIREKMQAIKANRAAAEKRGKGLK